MSAYRLISKDDNVPFPYDSALHLILNLPEADVELNDLSSLIAAGRKMHWTKEMIQSHEQMASRGQCFDFCWITEDKTEIRGTLFEDNIFFSVLGNEEATVNIIQLWAIELNVQIFKH